MEFSYLETSVRNSSIEIEDIGNCCIQTFTDDGNENILMISTALGWSKIIQFGPLLVDSEEDTGEYFSYCRYSIEFNQGKLYKTIDKFINPKNAQVTQVFEISADEALERLHIIKF